MKTRCSIPPLIIQLFSRGQEAGTKHSPQSGAKGNAQRNIEISKWSVTSRGRFYFPRPRKPSHIPFSWRDSYSGPVDIVSLQGDGGIGFAGHARPTVKSSRIFWYFFAGDSISRALRPSLFLLLSSRHTEWFIKYYVNAYYKFIVWKGKKNINSLEGFFYIANFTNFKLN